MVGDTHQRVVILHHHIFKNAGTSLDYVLKAAFGDRWVDIESPTGQQRQGQQAILDLLSDDPTIRALSTHTVRPQIRRLTHVTVLPVLFVRHPLDRIRSAYAFERRQSADTDGAKIARERGIKGYIEHFLQNRHDRRFRNFQSTWFAPLVQDGRIEIERAMGAIDQLPFVGVVERFDDSIRLLQHVTRLLGLAPNFSSAVKNRSPDRNGTLEDRLRLLRRELGDGLYRQLWACNMADCVVWAHARAALEDRLRWLSS